MANLWCVIRISKTDTDAKMVAGAASEIKAKLKLLNLIKEDPEGFYSLAKAKVIDRPPSRVGAPGPK